MVYEIAQIALVVAVVVLTVLVAYFTPKIVKLIEGKVGFDIPPAAEAHVQALAIAAIGYGEEYAHQWLKSASEKIPEKVKMDRAAEWFRDHAADLVTEWTSDQVRKYLESQLGIVRLKAAAGATNAIASTSVQVVEAEAAPKVIVEDSDDLITQEMKFDESKVDPEG